MSCFYHSGSKTSEPGDDNEQFGFKVDAFIETFRAHLEEAGWSSEPRYPYLLAQTTTDMSGSFNAGFEVYYAVFPPGWAPGSGPNAKLIIDALPFGSYTPPIGFEIYAVTGTFDKEVVHAEVVAAFLTFSPFYSTIYSNPDNAFPNTYIQNAVGVASTFEHPTAGIALNTSFTDFTNGGYALQTQDNGGHLSIFIGRDNVSGIEAYKPYIFFCREVDVQPLEFTMELLVDRGPAISIQFTHSDWEMFAWETGVIFSQLVHINGHIELAILQKPTGVLEAQFATAEGISGIPTRFRQTRRAAGQQFICVEGEELFTEVNNRHSPTLCSMFGDGDDNEWENGLSPITESWMSLGHLPNVESAIVGKLPYGIIINGSFVPDTPIFFWNEKTYHIVTRDAVRDGAGKVTTLAMNVINEEAAPPTCI